LVLNSKEGEEDEKNTIDKIDNWRRSERVLRKTLIQL
jgi:hypothetical protein